MTECAGMLRIEDELIVCDKLSDFNIIILPNNVRSLPLQTSRFVCSFLSLKLKFHSTFPFTSWETYIPKVLSGFRGHVSCRGLSLFFFPRSTPNPFGLFCS